MSQEIAECNCLYHCVSSQARTQGGFGRTPYFDGRIFVLSVSGSLKHLSIDTMIIERFRLASQYKNYGNPRRLSV